MKLSTFRADRAAGIRAAFAVALYCGGLQAASLLSATPSAVALTCNTGTGTGSAATIVIKPVTTLTNGALAVTVGALSGGLVVTPPVSTILNSTNQAQGLTYTVNLAAGCNGATSGSAAIKFYAGGVTDVQVTANTSVTASTSALVASPVTLTCVRSAGAPVSYTPGPAQIATVTSAAAGGTPFTMDTSTIPSWLTVAPPASGTAGSSGIPIILSAASPCGNYPAGSSNSASLHLRNQPAPDGLIPVTLLVLGPSPLSATPDAVAFSYTKGSNTPSFVDVALNSAGAGAAAFAVDTSSLPAWLAVDVVTGAVPKTLRFSTTCVADAVAQGPYSATVRVQVSGFVDLAVAVRLAISNPAPKLTVAEGAVRDITWTRGQSLPVPYITLESSSSGIPYSISTGGDLAPIVSGNFLKGFAYSYGTPIPVTLDPNIFFVAPSGIVLTGTVTITWGTPAVNTVVTFNIKVQSAGATVLAVSPLSLPTAAAGETFTVALTGTGFVPSPDAAQRTVVGVVSAGALLANVNIASTVVNSSNIILTITVPEVADPLLPFSPTGVGGTVNLGVCNPLGVACSIPTGAAQLTIGPNPVIRAVTSAAAFVQVASPNLPAVAPYDIVSVFGINFCTSAGTGCGDAILYGTLDPAVPRYPAALSPDAAGPNQRLLTVTFQTHANPPVAIAKAPLLIATDSQINLLVPSGLVPFIGKSVDIVVNFASASGVAMPGSAPFTVNIAATNPGIFTVGGDGQGEGAVLGLDDAMITRGNEAGMRQTPADSDTVQIFVTGLGAPDGTADNAGAGSGLWPADCVGTASFLTSLNLFASSPLTTVDGVLIASGLLNTGRLPPCLRASANLPTVTIGGQPATVAYAGWAPDAVAGQYQVNVRLPGAGAGPFTSASGAVMAGPLTEPVQLPVVVTARGRASQTGVTVWVAPRLKVAGPAGAGLRGTVGALWPAAGSPARGNTATPGIVMASQGTLPYQYAITGGSLPGGLALNAATGAISGTPVAAGSYTVTVTATDSAAKPLTGTAAFTLIVGAGR